ncbi:MAG: hypothetical protein HY288_11095, partial [Planctomycetia bacterium]|nr:hypothetical protein [Planctomycetia bacterium]
MVDQPQPISQDAQRYLAAQARGEPAPPAIEDSVPAKGKRRKKGPAAPHFGSLPKDAAASSNSKSTDIDGLLTQAEQALASVNSPNEPGHPPVTHFHFRDFAARPGSTETASLELIREVELD